MFELLPNTTATYAVPLPVCYLNLVINVRSSIKKIADSTFFVKLWLGSASIKGLKITTFFKMNSIILLFMALHAKHQSNYYQAEKWIKTSC